MRRTEASRGFTLLEVVVALACAALVLGAVLRIFSLGMRTADSAEMRAHGTMLAQSILAEIAASEDLMPREASGAFENGFRWLYQIGSYEDETGVRTGEEPPQELQLYRIDVAVSWGREDDPAGRVTLTTVRLGEGSAFSAVERFP
jgi:prepilin-type N-terminal cleavage/methylation domain-containing protein